MSLFEKIVNPNEAKRIKDALQHLPEKELNLEQTMSERMLHKLPLTKLEKVIEGEEALERLYQQLLKSAVRYALAKFKHIQACYNRIAQLHSPEKYKENIQRLDRNRRLQHIALVDSFNILSRNCVKYKRDNSWRDAIGWEINLAAKERMAAWAMGVCFVIYRQLARKEGGQNEFSKT